MFKLVDKKENKYLVLDTDDGVIEEYFWEDIINFLQSGGSHRRLSRNRARLSF